jgi:hypothetical protein
VLERPRGQLAHHVYTPARSTNPYGGPGSMGDDEGDVDKRRRRGTATSPYNDWQDWR